MVQNGAPIFAIVQNTFMGIYHYSLQSVIQRCAVPCRSADRIRTTNNRKKGGNATAMVSTWKFPMMMSVNFADRGSQFHHEAPLVAPTTTTTTTKSRPQEDQTTTASTPVITTTTTTTGSAIRSLVLSPWHPRPTRRSFGSCWCWDYACLL